MSNAQPLALGPVYQATANPMRCLVLLLLPSLLVPGCRKAQPVMAHYQPVSHWVEQLQDPDAGKRKKAVQILSNVGKADPAAIPALMEAVRDRDVHVRREAVLALLKIGPDAREAIPVLEEAQKDSDADVRDYAVKAVRRIQGDGGS